MGIDSRHAQRITGALEEEEHGLVVLGSREAARGVKPGEQARQESTGAPEPERVTLARRVRAAATASVDEAEFVRGARREGPLIRPRFAAGREARPARSPQRRMRWPGSGRPGRVGCRRRRCRRR